MFGYLLSVLATQGVFGKVQIALRYLSVSSPTKSVDKTYRSQPDPNLR
jgi:hypothetical protein